MQQKLFVIGDIHGEYDLLEKLLTCVDFETQQVVFVGDLIDRGPKIKQTIETVMQLVATKQAVCLKGNHEDIFLQWLKDPTEKIDWYLRNGGKSTIEQLLYEGVFDEKEPSEMVEMLQQQYGDIIRFFENLPLYYETDTVICVHAGVDLSLDDWHDTSVRDFLWIREPFHLAQNQTGKMIVFGHTPVQSLRGHVHDTSLWYHQQKVAIDGGAVYHGSLHGIVIESGKIIADYQYFHPEHQFGIN